MVKSQAQKEKQLRQHKAGAATPYRKEQHGTQNGKAENERKSSENVEKPRRPFSAERGHTSKDYSGILILEAV